MADTRGAVVESCYSVFRCASASIPIVPHLFRCKRPPCVATVSSLCEFSLCPKTDIMVERIQRIITEYETRLRRTPFAPRLSFGRPMLVEDRGPNAMLFTCLFLDEPMGFEFLQDVGLLRSKLQCNTCDGDMTWCVDSSGSRPNQRLVQVRFAALH